MGSVRGWYRWLRLSCLVLTLFSVPRTGSARSFSAYRALPLATQWFNTSRPLTGDDFRGRLLLVDFWTYACINCEHVLADLKQLETEFGHELTVVGVHSAKFASEKENDALRDAVLRNDITHPVANDRDFKVWNAFEVNGWPTLVLIDPDGDILKRYSGEGHVAEIRQDIADYFTKHPKLPGAAALAELPLAPEKSKERAATLRFPGKVLWAMHEGHPFLFIADSGHHRVLGAQLDGPNLAQVRYRIGKEGESGDADGDFQSARFHSPQGLAYDAGTLFVADLGNHKVRAIDLRKETVVTLAGTGKAETLRAASEVPALTTALNSPWDLALMPGRRQLAIAMAGAHQIWAYDRDKKSLSVLAGNGAESIDDGTYPDNTLAQPSGLSVLGDKLFFVDSETSSLRQWEAGRVITLVGTGLFDFGFRNGPAGRALMQHPLGVYADKDGIFVADTYNHAIRRWQFVPTKSDPTAGVLETVAGNSIRGAAVSAPITQAAFAEPGGVSGTKGMLYVADTNNGVVRVIDLKEKHVENLILDETASEERSISAVRQVAALEDLPRAVTVPAAEVSSQKTVSIHVELEPGWKMNAQGPSWLALFQVDAKGAVLVKEFGRRDLQRAKVKLPALVDNATYRLQGTFYFCENRRNSLCVLRSLDQTITATPAQENTDLPLALQR